METYQIPETLILFLKTIKLSSREIRQGQNTTYKELAVVIGEENQPVGFVVTNGSFQCDNICKEPRNHQKAYWYFTTFESAYSYVYGNPVLTSKAALV